LSGALALRVVLMYTSCGSTAMPPAEVTEKLGLTKMKDRPWYVHPRYVEMHTDVVLSCNGSR
jgi:hypothetical protein